jgi:hypothetical protein
VQRCHHVDKCYACLFGPPQVVLGSFASNWRGALGSFLEEELGQQRLQHAFLGCSPLAVEVANWKRRG